MLVGPTKLGKTDWARSLPGTHMYMQTYFNIELWNPDADYLILDDINFVKFPECRKAIWGGAERV